MPNSPGSEFFRGIGYPAKKPPVLKLLTNSDIDILPTKVGEWVISTFSSTIVYDRDHDYTNL